MWWELFFFDPVQRGGKAPLEISLKTLGNMPEQRAGLDHSQLLPFLLRDQW